MQRLNAAVVYAGSDGDLTKRFYAELEQLGPVGIVAVNLFRAQKCSTRAKAYSRKHKGLAYDRKDWSLQNLCKALDAHAAELGIRYGWKLDPLTPGFEWVLYIDLPQGQVSFHAAVRHSKAAYDGDWDGQRNSAERIIAFCDDVYGQVRASAHA